MTTRLRRFLRWVVVTIAAGFLLAMGGAIYAVAAGWSPLP